MKSQKTAFTSKASRLRWSTSLVTSSIWWSTNSRYNFNTSAQAYNTAIKRFPTVFFAAMMVFTERPYFEAKAGSETPPAVHFDFNSPTNAAPAH